MECICFGTLRWLVPGIGTLNYQMYYELNKLSNVCLFSMFGESGDDMDNTVLQVISGSLVPSRNCGNASNQKTSAANH